MSQHGIVFDIKKYAIHDGPGIRTTLFFKGCPLDCWWCHNPESRDSEIEILPLSLESNRRSEKARTVGRTMNVEQAMEEILKDEIFFDESGGGVTLSGGEPMHQPEFLKAILTACRQAGLHVALDTSGHVATEEFANIHHEVDLFLYDLKLADSQDHRRYTGVDNEQILANLRFLCENGSTVWVRIPLIPKITDTEKNLNDSIEILQSLHHKPQVSLLPYNLFGEEKFRRFGIEPRVGSLPTQSPAQLRELARPFEEAGFQVNFGG